MLVVLSGGGTAGHINPALAVAEVLQERGCDVRFAGCPTGVEARLAPQAGLPFVPFEAAGFNRRHPLSLAGALAKIQKSTQAAKRWFAEERPDVVVGFGGYVSIPVARAAQSCGVPVVVHEQNSVMGMANKYLARRARAVCVTYAQSAADVGVQDRVRVTGNPVRASVLAATREEGRTLLGVPEDALMLLVFGGSLGARQINEGVAACKEDLLAVPGLHVVHITGPRELENAQQALALTPEEQKRWHVMGYQDRMGETLAAADAVVSRSGATSLAEISARAIPALLVPFPHATEDHQTKNAQAYVDAGCAYLLPDDRVATPEFRRLVLSLVQEPDVRARMAQAARGQKTADAARILADVVMEAAGRGPHALQ